MQSVYGRISAPLYYKQSVFDSTIADTAYGIRSRTPLTGVRSLIYAVTSLVGRRRADTRHGGYQSVPACSARRAEREGNPSTRPLLALLALLALHGHKLHAGCSALQRSSRSRAVAAPARARRCFARCVSAKCGAAPRTGRRRDVVRRVAGACLSPCRVFANGRCSLSRSGVFSASLASWRFELPSFR